MLNLPPPVAAPSLGAVAHGNCNEHRRCVIRQHVVIVRGPSTDITGWYISELGAHQSSEGQQMPRMLSKVGIAGHLSLVRRNGAVGMRVNDKK
jgi:hypothetical protein